MSDALEHGMETYTREQIETVAKAIANEWGIDAWGKLSYQAERALDEDPRNAVRYLAIAVLDTVHGN